MQMQHRPARWASRLRKLVVFAVLFVIGWKVATKLRLVAGAKEFVSEAMVTVGLKDKPKDEPVKSAVTYQVCSAGDVCSFGSSGILSVPAQRTVGMSVPKQGCVHIDQGWIQADSVTAKLTNTCGSERQFVQLFVKVIGADGVVLSSDHTYVSAEDGMQLKETRMASVHTTITGNAAAIELRTDGGRAPY